MSEQLEEWEEDLIARAERDAGIEHANGVRWYEAPVPRRWHRCWTQTSGWHGLTLVKRCPCGAIRVAGQRRWSERNSRRKEARRGC